MKAQRLDETLDTEQQIRQRASRLVVDVRQISAPHGKHSDTNTVPFLLTLLFNISLHAGLPYAALSHAGTSTRH